MSGPGRGRSGLRRAIVWLAGLVLLTGSPLAQESRAATPGESGYTGKTLSEALLDLRSRGLKIVFTSEVVRPEMTVTVQPVAVEPRQILEELLEPHGLVARDGPRGTLVVVRPAPDPLHVRSSIGGVVRSRPGSAPVAGAAIRVVESGAETTSSGDGAFLIPDHDTGRFTLVISRAGFAIARVEAVSLIAGRRTEISILLDPAPVVEEAVVVTPSRVSLLREEPGATIGLSRDEILALPHLGDDFFRAISLVPGVSANDVSAQFHVRGGRRDETQILLDGQELYEAYHLKDFDSALSFVASSTLGSADLTTGGFSAEFGDRMSGVLDMTTVTPSGRPRGRVGMSVLSLQAGGAAGFAEDRGNWLVEARRGTIDLVEKLLGNEDPRYADAYAKLEYRLDERNGLRVHLLHSDDDFRFKEVREDGSKRTDTSYRSTYVWLAHSLILSSKMLVETVVSRTGIDQDRRGVELDETVSFDVFDARRTEVLGLRQGWNYQATSRSFLKWGFELRGFRTDYDYVSSFDFSDPLAGIRDGPAEGSTSFVQRFEEDHTSLYVADRIRLAEPVTLELGLRHDRHSLTDESHLSPRLNLAWAPDEASVFRIAWGRFLQSQRPYELQVEDGDPVFYPTERSEHRVVGYERILRRDSKSGGFALRVEVYQRRVGNPRPRYENLYEVLNTFPEVEPDRIRIAPERSVAEGIELFLRGKAGRRLDWFANYTYASTRDKDEISGREVPRKIDQRHALNLDLGFRIGEHWNLNLAWRYHSGWPTTSLSLQEEVNDEGETVFVPVPGPLYDERLSDYHRLDLRASREFEVDRGKLLFFVDVQNAYDRRNIAGFDIEIDEVEGRILFDEEYWAGILPSVGITYQF